MQRIVLRKMILAMLVGWTATVVGANADDAKDIIIKAIKAQGGEEKLAPFKAGRSKGKGTLILHGKELELTLETIYHLPDRYKTVMEFQSGEAKIKAVQVLNGAKAWVSVAGNVEELDKEPLKAFKEELFATNVELLVPLIRDKGYTLSMLKETKVAGKPAVGVKVTAKDHKDIELYFDKATLLPVRTVRPSLDADTMKETATEVLYSAVKDFDGIKAPTKILINQNGKKLMELELTELKKADKIDVKEFAKPE